jgi:hypothetical protein
MQQLGCPDRLAGAQHLRICFKAAELVPGDAQALSTLTGLTHLVLDGLHQGADDVATTALACSLKQLRHLDLRGCRLGSMSCLAAIGQLRQLTELHLDGNELTKRGLMLLTGLSRLQQLGVSCSKEVTPGVLGRFWAIEWQQRP